jgi:hypothetical protein
MRKVIGVSFLAVAGLMFGLGADTDGGGKKLFLICSADERNELHPCG